MSLTTGICFQTDGFKALCQTICVFQTYGFKAYCCVSQLVFVFKPMVLRLFRCVSQLDFFQTNGFKASRCVSQLVFVFQPMVLRHLVESHNWHVRLRLQKNQWLMWCFSVSLGNRFLKPMVLRRYFPTRQKKSVCKRTNG